jgi:hypothetical protein
MNRLMKTINVRSLCAALAIAAATSVISVQAAQPSAAPKNWWVYLHNDKATDIQGLLAKGADPNIRYTNGQPALMRAVVEGAWGVFDVLAANPRTDINATNVANETPLMYLAVAGETDRAKALIARGAQVNRLGWTPLHYAASKGKIDTAKLLLAHKAIVNAPSPEGTTPLMMAAFSGDMAMVQLLLNAGADITTRNLKGESVADWAVKGKQQQLAEKLTPMIVAAENKRQAARTGGLPPAAIPPVVTAPIKPTDTTQKPDSDPNKVHGVTGIRLNNYE